MVRVIPLGSGSSGNATLVAFGARRLLVDAGLSARYAPRDEGALLLAGAATYEQLMATGAARVSWERFVAEYCVPRPGQPA